ncbi:MAG: hypothetical protein Q4C70_14140 [Planctomycetia bacterium]|nr:hypothetical protein [Planctomycetia bacterium]
MDGKTLTSILTRLICKRDYPQNIEIVWKKSPKDDEKTLVIKRKGDEIQVIVIQ